MSKTPQRAYKNLEFLNSPAARHIRILCEYEETRQRFMNEAQITGHLQHPSIVPLYLFGEDSETHAPFYAMRYVGSRLTGLPSFVQQRRQICYGRLQ